MPSRCNKVLTPRNEAVEWRAQRGNSSVGRARPCQGRGRGFESLFPLQFHEAPFAGLRFFRASQKRMLVEECGTPSVTAGWQSGYAADCKSAYAGSIPTSASIIPMESGNPASAGFLVLHAPQPACRSGVSRDQCTQCSSRLQSFPRKLGWRNRSVLHAPQPACRSGVSRDQCTGWPVAADAAPTMSFEALSFPRKPGWRNR